MIIKNPKCVIIDHGLGNLLSIERAISATGGESVITEDLKKISNADRVILPGVGAFGSAMEIINKKGISDAIYEFCNTGRPLLGICLGMQLLMSESYEFGLYKGLNLIKGKVVRFMEPEPSGPFFKIPQIGWNKLEYSLNDKDEKIWDNSILRGLSEGTFVYFVHSFFVIPDDYKNVLSETHYGRNRFCSSIKYENITGCQYHPEKSGEIGLHIYKNFLNG